MNFGHGGKPREKSNSRIFLFNRQEEPCVQQHPNCEILRPNHSLQSSPPSSNGLRKCTQPVKSAITLTRTLVINATTTLKPPSTESNNKNLVSPPCLPCTAGKPQPGLLSVASSMPLLLSFLCFPHHRFLFTRIDKGPQK